MAGDKRGRKRGRPVNNNNELDLSTDEKSAKKIKICHTVGHRSHGTVEGAVLACGEGDTGQLGLGPDIMDRTKPAKVNIPANVVQVCCGGMHTVVVTSAGRVVTWGCNDEGALGRVTEDEDDCMSPGEVALEGKVVQVSAGDSHTAAITDDGKLYCWGIFRDANGAIGLTCAGNQSFSPLQILAGEVVTKVASGGDHLVALTDTGHVYTLGCAEQGQLGRVAECFSQRGGRKGLDLLLTPAKVHFKKRSLRFSDVWTGQYVTYVQARGTGQIYSWGLNNYYQLGFGDMVNRFVPDVTSGFGADKGWVALAGGQHHTIALDKQGQVYALGRMEYGRLGLGEKDGEEKTAPTPLPALKNKKVVSVGAGSACSFAVTDKGELYAWGIGTSKQLAQTDEEEDFWEPALMTGKQLQDRSGLQISSGGQHTVILAKDKS